MTPPCLAGPALPGSSRSIFWQRQVLLSPARAQSCPCLPAWALPAMRLGSRGSPQLGIGDTAHPRMSLGTAQGLQLFGHGDPPCLLEHRLGGSPCPLAGLVLAPRSIAPGWQASVLSGAGVPGTGSGGDTWVQPPRMQLAKEGHRVPPALVWLGHSPAINNPAPSCQTRLLSSQRGAALSCLHPPDQTLCLSPRHPRAQGCWRWPLHALAGAASLPEDRLQVAGGKQVSISGEATSGSNLASAKALSAPCPVGTQGEPLGWGRQHPGATMGHNPIPIPIPVPASHEQAPAWVAAGLGFGQLRQHK